MKNNPSNSGGNPDSQAVGGNGSARSGDWLAEGGELGALIRSRDWAATPLGLMEYWPQPLRTALNIVVGSRVPMSLVWGPELILFYNDAYREIAADRHPEALGQPMRKAWHDLWPELEPVFTAVMARGESFFFENWPLRLVRHGSNVNVYFTIAYSPVRLENGNVGGVLDVLHETTGTVESDRLLRESEEKYRALVETTATGFVSLDGQGRVLDANLEYVRLTGRKEVQNILGHSVLEWTAPYDQARNTAEVERCWVRGFVRDLEMDYVAPDGRATPIEINASAFPTAQGNVVLALCRDITERKRVENELRKAKQIYESIFLLSPEAIVVTTEREGRFLAVNDANERILGYRRDETVGHTVYELRIWEDPEDRQRVRRRLQEQGFLKNVEVRMRHKSGRRIDAFLSIARIVIEGEPCMINVLTDITERKRMEEALRSSEEKFAKAFRSSPDMIVITSLETGLVMEANEHTADLVGYTREEIIGKSMVALKMWADPKQRERYIARLSDSGQVRDMEAQMRKKDGTVIDVLLAGEMIELHARKFTLTTIRNITEQKRAEEVLRDTDRRKNEFMALLSHELRNPLAPIRTSLFILERVAPDSEQARQAKAVIDRQSTHLSRLVDELLDLTRITSGKIELRRETLDVNDLARRTVEDHREMFRAAGIALQFKAALGQVWVNGDSTRLAQVIGNLLQNAAKFTPQGGTAEISVGEDAAISQAVMTVRDTGIGFAPELLPRLFETFTQADKSLDRSKGGLGLGLSLVKKLIEMHGGEVNAASDGLGQGAVFTIRLPLATKGCKPAAEHAADRGAGPHHRILVIEDNPDAANSLRELLELSGHNVAVAQDGPHGIEKARVMRPDVVLCDIGLPGMDGYAVARALRADPDLGRPTLVALTGYAQYEDVEKSKVAGFNVHLTKPYDMALLEKVIASANLAR